MFSTYNDRSQPLGIMLRSCLGVAFLVYPAFIFGRHVAKRATAFLSWSFYVSTQGKLSHWGRIMLHVFFDSSLSFFHVFIHLLQFSFICAFVRLFVYFSSMNWIVFTVRHLNLNQSDFYFREFSCTWERADGAHYVQQDGLEANQIS